MATYVVLGNFTDQGARTIKDTTKRADAVRQLGEKMGVHVKEIFWTLGSYDVVTLCEAADDSALTAFGLSLAAAGNVRTQTLRAFNKDEVTRILAKTQPLA